PEQHPIVGGVSNVGRIAPMTLIQPWGGQWEWPAYVKLATLQSLLPDSDPHTLVVYAVFSEAPTRNYTDDELSVWQFPWYATRRPISNTTPILVRSNP